MPWSRIIAFLATVADFVFCGILSNGFIAAVMITEWAKSRRLAACEQLLLSLGISNIFATFALSLKLFILSVTTKRSNSIMLLPYFIFCVGFIRYWLTAWLCVFYCVKILNSSHSFLLWWKMRISRLVPRLIVGSCIVSFLASSFVVLSVSKQLQSDGTANITNTTQEEKMGHLWKVPKIFFLVIGSGCPLIIVFLCSIVVVVSLSRHVCHMTSKGSNFRDLRTEAHVKAAGTVLSLLVLYISYYVTQTVGLVLDYQKKEFYIVLCLIVLLMYAPVQAAILVLSNSKLKQTASRMFARSKS